MIYNINARYSAKNNCCIYRIGRWHVLYNFKWYFNLSDIFGHFIQNNRRTLWIDHAFTQAMHINQRNTHRWKCIWFYIKWINIVFTINLSKSKKNRFYFAFKASDLLKKKDPKYLFVLHMLYYFIHFNYHICAEKNIKDVCIHIMYNKIYLVFVLLFYTCNNWSKTCFLTDAMKQILLRWILKILFFNVIACKTILQIFSVTQHHKLSKINNALK